MKERHKAVPAVYLFLMKNNAVLLGRRCNTGYMDGKYMVPAGHVEAGESLCAAMIRETKEEIGIDVEEENLKLVHVVYRAKHDETGERMDFFFTVEQWRGDIENREPEKCNDLKWFPLENLPHEMPPYVRTALENSMRGLLLTELDW